MAGTRYRIEMMGTDVLQAIFKSVGAANFMRAVSQGVQAEAYVIMRNAKREVPLDDGPLRASGVVEPVRTVGPKWFVRLGFGGAAKAYALIQHENLTFNHKPGRKAKYLEDPVRAHIPLIEKNLAARVESYFSPRGLS